MTRTPNAARRCARVAPPLRLTASFVLAAFGGAAVGAPDVRTDDDYVAIVLEAEDADSSDASWNARWVVTGPDTETQGDDDENHSSGAVGNTYVELLPDTRENEDDALIQEGPDRNYWDTPGIGPKLKWTVDVPRPGRWYVHIRSYSTGTEDNGAHMGIDGSWPASGSRFQACIAGGGWQWRSHQRDSGGVGSCGVSHTIWLTVDEAGEHEIQLAAREDGFEIDRLMLITDLSENTRICQPSGTDGISCRNGSLGGPDELVDLAVSLEGGPLDGGPEGRYRVTAAVENLDAWDTATNTALAIDLGEHFELVENDAGCTFDGVGLSCPIGGLQPTGPEDAREFTFAVDAVGEDVTPSLEASVTSDVEEERVENDVATFNGERTDPAKLPELAARLVTPTDGATAGESAPVMVLLDNVGTADADAFSVRIGLPEWMSAGTLPAQCVAGRPIICSVDALAPGAQAMFGFDVTAARAGTAGLTVSATAAGIPTPAGALVLLDVAAAEPEPVPDPVVPEEQAPAEKSGGSGGGAPSGMLLVLLGAVALRRRR